jgi:hypothetical protein
MVERSPGEFSGGNREPGNPASLTAPGLLFTFAGFLLLNGLLSIHVWAPGYDFALILRPTFDSLALFLLVFLVSRVKKGAHALGLGFLSLLGSFLFFFSMGEAVTLHVYGRSFLPLVDTAYFMEFIRLLFAGESGRKTFLFASLFSLFLIGSAAGVSAIICGAAGYLRRLRRPLPAKAILTGAVLLLALTTGLPRLPGGSLAKSVYLWNPRAAGKGARGARACDAREECFPVHRRILRIHRLRQGGAPAPPRPFLRRNGGKT